METVAYKQTRIRKGASKNEVVERRTGNYYTTRMDAIATSCCLEATYRSGREGNTDTMRYVVPVPLATKKNNVVVASSTRPFFVGQMGEPL